ncbi:hypothetical protein DESUT3_26010 [Desulfuromonas versatilis]|uniref:Uncharacterized protein n=1 Tax=Desulfuromonas versatilis TaxID=2802975 RepID=A0ABM8HXU1_9BACT|nr:hypothetical protein [Desulfuromonas versatilis]BCR05532.1 hypothetical protein DESUT3_26010 [Desulfuromonas versatilis]
MSRRYANPYTYKSEFRWIEPGFKLKALSLRETALVATLGLLIAFAAGIFDQDKVVEGAAGVATAVVIVAIYILTARYKWRSVAITGNTINVFSAGNTKDDDQDRLQIKLEDIEHFSIVTDGSDPKGRCALEILDKSGVTHKILISPKVDQFRLHTYLAETVGKKTTPDDVPLFDLGKDKAAIMAMATMALLALYAFTDGAFISEGYAGRPAFLYMAAGGFCLLMASFLLLMLGRVPTPEAVTLAMLIGISASLALYPGLLRVNQLTDKVGLQYYRYIYAGDNILSPVNVGPPELEIRNDYGYWESFPTDHVFDIGLRKGGLGFYQINLEPIYDDMGDFYQKRRKLK